MYHTPKWNPIFRFDCWVHDVVVKASHTIQKQFHLNRDYLIVGCLGIILTTFVHRFAERCLAMGPQPSLNSALIKVLGEACWMSVGVLIYSRILKKRLEQGREFEVDPRSAERYDRIDARIIQTYAFNIFRQGTSVYGSTGLLQLMARLFVHVRDWEPILSSDRVNIGHDVYAVAFAVTLHLYSSDHVSPDKRTSFELDPTRNNA